MAIGCCENIVKYFLFFVNLMLMLAGFVVLGFSIYGLVDSQSASKAIENGAHLVSGDDTGFNLTNVYFWFVILAPYLDPTLTVVCVTFIVVSSVIIIVTFLGCCGAWKENNCLLFMNFLILLILLCGTVAGAVILYFQNVDMIKPSLVSSLKNYVPHPADQVSDDPLTSAWDDIQKQFSCCGIDGYGDFTNETIFEIPIYPDLERNYIPSSCCWGLMDDNVMADCRRRPNDPAYIDRTRGCFSEFQKTLLANRDAVGIATLTIVVFLFINLVAVYTFTMLVMPMAGYAPVHRA